MRWTQSDKSKYSVNLLQEFSDRENVCMGRSPVCVNDENSQENVGNPCSCDSISPRGWESWEDWVTSKSRADSHLRLLAQQKRPWLPSHQPLLLPLTCSWDIKDTLWPQMCNKTSKKHNHISLCITKLYTSGSKEINHQTHARRSLRRQLSSYPRDG